MNERAIRVLWLIKGLGPGGAERLLAEQARAGRTGDCSYEVAYLLDQKQHLVPELEALGVATHGLGVRSERDLRWIPRLHAHLRTGGYDVVHAHSPFVASVARLLVRTLPRANRPRFVYTEHNRWPSYRLVTQVANRATYSLNEVILAVSHDVKESVSARWRPRVEVVIHGIDVAAVRAELAHRDAARREMGVEAGESLVVTVANLRHGKNYPGLLQAAAVTIERGLPVRFVAAGQGPLAAEIRAQLAGLGLGDRFRLLGYRDDATRVIAGADLFVLASHHEGLPVTVMEALTLGTPVVAPAVGGLPEVVRDGENGILVEPGSPHALADGIATALEPDIRCRLVAGARDTGERFAASRSVHRIEALYRQLCR